MPGFGSLLARATVEEQLGGEILWDRKLAGMTIRLTVAQEHLITE
jgi:hypothetical protein